MPDLRLYRLEPVEPTEHLEAGRYVTWDEEENRPTAGLVVRERTSLRELADRLRRQLRPMLVT